MEPVYSSLQEADSICLTRKTVGRVNPFSNGTIITMRYCLQFLFKQASKQKHKHRKKNSKVLVWDFCIASGFAGSQGLCTFVCRFYSCYILLSGKLMWDSVYPPMVTLSRNESIFWKEREIVPWLQTFLVLHESAFALIFHRSLPGL